MRSFILILVSVLISTFVSTMVLKPAPSTAPSVQKQESVYERVTQSKILRCGYYTWPPFINKNIQTNKMEGLYVDLTEELAKGFGWKVEWVEEIASTDFITALNGNRVDMLCAPMAPVQQRTQWIYFSVPHFYVPYMAYARADDKRFDNNLQKINNPDYTLSTMEGELTSIVARTRYPKAKVLEISAIQGPAQLLENVVTGKADVILQDPFTFGTFDAANPGKLRKIPTTEDNGVFFAAYSMKRGEDDFKYMIDAAITELLDRGYIEKLAKDYKLLDLGIYLPADGYKK
jgi:ABC-type amino acid transport substrate-binding protein